MTVLEAEKVAALIEETSTCTSSDDSFSSGDSPQCIHYGVEGVIASNTDESEESNGEFPELNTEDIKLSSKRSEVREYRKVSFSNVHVKEFDRVVGDNPSCSFGVPITIGWILENEAEIDMDDYETFRNSNRRSKLQLIMAKETRELLLMDWGYSTEEISKAVKEKIRIRNQRNFTLAKLGTFDSLEELIERLSRKMKKTFIKKSKTRTVWNPSLVVKR